MNEILKKLSLDAGGSHYPSINPQLQQKFAELVIEECIDILNQRNDHAVIVNSIKEIKEHFGLQNE